VSTRTLPHDLDTEQAILSCLFIDTEAIDRVRDLLRPEDFYAERNGRIYAVATELADQGEAIDVLLVKIALERHEWLAKAGGVEYLAELAQKMPTAVSVRHYAQVVQDLSLQRTLLQTGDALVRSASNGHFDRTSALAELERVIATTRQRSGFGGPAAAPPGMVMDQILSAEELMEPVSWLPFLGHDGVVVDGWSHVIGGYTGTGKSPLIKHASVPWLRMGKRVLWVSEENYKIWRDDGDVLRSIYGDTSVPWGNQRIIPASGRSASALVKDAAACRFDVLVIDTLRQVCKPVSEKDAAEVRVALDPWLSLAGERGATVIVLHHHRKSEGEHGERFAGSEAILTPFDVALEYKFAQKENQRFLSGVRIRGGHPRPYLCVERGSDFGQLLVLGEAGYVKTRELDSLVADILEDTAEELTTRDVRQALGDKPPSLDTVERSLIRLARKERIRRIPPLSEHVAGKVVKWRGVDLFG